VQWPTRPLPYGPRRTLMKINKKFALQLPKQDFYSFRLCTVEWPTKPSGLNPPLLCIKRYLLRAQSKIH